MKYEAVIGLEVHVQLRTKSKMFTRVAAGYGEPENTLTDPVVLALPGALPVLNKAALDQIIKTGLMLGCTIAPVCKWDRKNYFYPDSPKNYQISQFDQPICIGGSVEIELPGAARNIMGEHKNIPLTRIHLEEDVGKLNHGAAESLVDYNRAGTPLMEIVSDPAMHSADEAFAFLTALRITLVQGGISECDMEKGQMRCDANISIRLKGETKLGIKVELKNLNSISFVRDGIAHEIRRQTAVVESGGIIVQETRDYDGQTGASQSLRSKEMAHDYRYFPDPDLMPVKVDESWKNSILATLPEHYFDRQRRYMKDYQLSYSTASVIVVDVGRYTEFEREVDELKVKENDLSKVVEGVRVIANLIANVREKVRSEFGVPAIYLDPIFPYSKPVGYTPLMAPVQTFPILTSSLPITGSVFVDGPQAKQSAVFVNPPSGVAPGATADLAYLVIHNEVSATGANVAYESMYRSYRPVNEIVADKNLKQSTDTGALEKWVADAIAANPKAAEAFKAGNEKSLNAIKGAVMKASQGKANPKLVDDVVRKQLSA